MQKKVCKTFGCNREVIANGFCKSHYYGDKRKKAKQKGLCTECKKSNDTKHNICSKCREKKEEYRKNLNEHRRKNKLCQCCGKSASIITEIVKTNKKKRYFCEKHYYENAARSTTGSAKNGHILKEIFEEQNGLCAYTQEKLILGKNASVDHFVPKFDGGSNSKENLKWVLWDINKMKFKHSYEKFVSMCQEVVNYMSTK